MSDPYDKIISQPTEREITMGLDMYLSASEYISRYDYTEDYDRSDNNLFAQIVSQFGVEVDPNGHAGLQIDFPMGYWRKANQIHNWFVETVGNGIDECQKMFVNRESLEELRNLCNQVLTDHSLADEHLPTGSGFFFGSTDYDEWYFKQLEHTLEIIDRCLVSKFDYFEYQASW
jgi:hypothetical protein